MATTQIKNGFQGGSDDQLLVNPDGSINVNGGGGSGGATAITDAPDGTTYVDIENVGGKNALDVNVKGGTVTGSIQPEGLNIAGRNTTLSVSTTAIPLPAIPLANRNAMSIRNLSQTDVLYIGFDSSVTADSVVGITSGWQLGPNEGFNIDVQGSIPIYGIAASGSILVQVMELS